MLYTVRIEFANGDETTDEIETFNARDAECLAERKYPEAWNVTASSR